MKKIAFLPLLLLMIWGCATNPVTGRTGLSLVSNAQLFPQSFAQYSQVLQEGNVIKGTKDAQMVQDVGTRIKYAAEKLYSEMGLSNQLQGYEWQFSLLQSDEVNAWCMPGGKVAVYSGILPITQNATGLAVVMGHEVGHALAGHSAEQVSNAMVAQYGGAILGSTISNEQYANIFNQLYPVGAQVGLLSYSRKMELDADETGLYLMAMAGFDPSQAVPFWERMSSNGSQKVSEFLSTHPSDQTRISKIKAAMPKAMAYYNASPYKGK